MASLGKMNKFLDIQELVVEKDSEGFAIRSYKTLKSVRAEQTTLRMITQNQEYQRDDTTVEINTTIYYIRRIPKFEVRADMFLYDKGSDKRYNIMRITDRRLYLEIWARSVESSG